MEFLLGLKAAGWTETQILENYSQISADDWRGVFAFAKALIEEERYLPLPHVAQAVAFKAGWGDNASHL